MRCRCGRPSKPLEGVFLTALYPGQFSCLGCGRRTRHCDCPGVTPLRGDERVTLIPDPFVARRLAGGWGPQAIATAAGVSLRTAYRYLRLIRTEEIRVGDHEATFVIRRGQPPARVSTWREA